MRLLSTQTQRQISRRKRIEKNELTVLSSKNDTGPIFEGTGTKRRTEQDDVLKTCQKKKKVKGIWYIFKVMVSDQGHQEGNRPPSSPELGHIIMI